MSGVTLGIELVVGAEAGKVGAFQPLSSIGQRLARLLTRGVIVIPAFLLASCGMFADVWEWNQKLTVEVLVDGKVVSGSAVSHVWWQEANALGVSPSGYKGEATVVDLGTRGQLFALIGEETKYIAQYTLHDDLGYGRGDYERLLPAIMHFRGTKNVPRDRYPLFVTFTNLSDPTTLRKVDPEDLAAVFGSGVSLKLITLGVTDEKPTEGAIEKRLPWLETVGRSRATLLPNPPKFLKDQSDIQRVNSGNFSTELFK
ncbi:MAG: hypothetical protein J0I79_15945 [Mesorhizobium sp.]|uniref:hypothetical protein n=1 Tax=Mesorhizobium sp. TaxID=1871066 RepID=UPI001AC7B03F|nr:hypothetical protein [Mesorhizobium sp.]MBN9219436.1 hypothetical protein [Mesorhizobium sp.]